MLHTGTQSLESAVDVAACGNVTSGKGPQVTTLDALSVHRVPPEFRKANKLSQEELANAVGVTRQTITSLEVGKYTASLVLAYKIAHYFGLKIEDVFDFSEVEEI